MPDCQRCGNHVTADYAAVFGDNEDEVYGCPDCRFDVDMYDGAGADPNYEPRVQTDNARRVGMNGANAIDEKELWAHGGGD